MRDITGITYLFTSAYGIQHFRLALWTGKRSAFWCYLEYGLVGVEEEQSS